MKKLFNLLKILFVFLFKTIKLLAILSIIIIASVCSAYFMCSTFELTTEEIIVMNMAMFLTAFSIYIFFRKKFKNKWAKLGVFFLIYVIASYAIYETRTLYAEFFLGRGICNMRIEDLRI